MARLPENILGGASGIDPRIALQKLNRGQALTDAESEALGLTSPASSVIPTMLPDVVQDSGSPAYTPSSTGKKIIGYIRWTHPVSGVTYNVPRYDDGTDAISEWGGGAQVPQSFMMVTDENKPGGSSTGPTGQLTYKASDGRTFTDESSYLAYQSQLDQQRGQRQSAYDLLYQQFKQYGLESLVTPLKGLIEQAVPDSEFTIRLRDSEPYKKRFAANAQRIAKGLRALSEAEYIQKEDAYQEKMRQYGMPESYYARGELGAQPGFEKLLANDVSVAELEDRLQTGQEKLLNAAPEIMAQLKGYYGINQGDILAYVLDPQNAITDIKRKVGAAQIGGAAAQAGLGVDRARAEELQKYGVTQQAAEQGYQTIGGGLQRGSELASIYSQSPYTQTTAEQEVFGMPGSTEAAAKRKKLIGLERATFGAQTGAGGAFERERAGGY